jgi:hypothetical protein
MAASRAQPATRILQKRLSATSVTKLLEAQISRRATTAETPARWLPRPKDQAKYSHAVLAAEPNSGGVARFDAERDTSMTDWRRAAYAIVRIPSGESKELVETVAPGLLDRLNLKVGGRNVQPRREKKPQHIGAEIILSQTKARSGAHHDSTPSILIRVVGTRIIWCAPNVRLSHLPRGKDVTPLHRDFDPAGGGPKEGWEKPLEAKPGDVIFLPRCDWHSIESEAGSIAISVSVQPMSGCIPGIPGGRVKGASATRPVVGLAGRVRECSCACGIAAVSVSPAEKPCND